MIIQITKGTDCKVKFKIYRDYVKREPIDLSNYIDLICVVTEQENLLIEKKFSTNGIMIDYDNNQNQIKNTVTVLFNPEDTKQLKPNPAHEDRIRLIEVFGIDNNKKITRFYHGPFYIEGSRYKVRI